LAAIFLVGERARRLFRKVSCGSANRVGLVPDVSCPFKDADARIAFGDKDVLCNR
jgi:hypothetical protein